MPNETGISEMFFEDDVHNLKLKCSISIALLNIQFTNATSFYFISKMYP